MSIDDTKRIIIESLENASTDVERWDIILKYKDHLTLWIDNDLTTICLNEKFYTNDDIIDREYFNFRGYITGSAGMALLKSLGVNAEPV